DVLANVDAVVIHERLGLVDSVRDFAHGGARKARALLKDEPDALFERVVAVALQQPHETPFARPNRRNLGAVIAHGALRHAHVGTDDRRDLGISFPALKSFTKGSCRPSE